jgi:hypothetical protein
MVAGDRIGDRAGQRTYRLAVEPYINQRDDLCGYLQAVRAAEEDERKKKASSSNRCNSMR